MHNLILFLGFQTSFLIALVYLNKIKWNGKFSNVKIAGILAFLFYLSIIVVVIFTNYHLKNKLESFDINHDGFFTNEEINTEQKLAMKDVISDVGRNFAPFIGILYSLVYFIIILPIIALINKTLFNKRLPSNS